MKGVSIRDACVFGVLVLAGIAGRFIFLDIPNFKPTAAVALFAGFFFARRHLAILVPLLIMLLSNLWLDGYLTWGEMIVVYAAMIFPAVLRRRFGRIGQRRANFGAGRFAVCLTAPSLVFFVTTNFAVWLFNGIYPMTAAGLANCYVQALPFYGYSLAGDLVFIPVVFGCYYALTAATPKLACETAASG